jgi:hypothetical protein
MKKQLNTRTLASVFNFSFTNAATRCSKVPTLFAHLADFARSKPGTETYAEKTAALHRYLNSVFDPGNA